ncbi:uncharacterized protein TNCT_587041 [Trichonephila clavata]|uniref:Gag-like protein n=1 Tax=Trichonephila clavata TaxID=2740835 RepID=A0A8X6FI68_TRICU|nr:uncharacterized protein TNCT_587041 [Trichonephila clavata]
MKEFCLANVTSSDFRSEQERCPDLQALWEKARSGAVLWQTRTKWNEVESDGFFTTSMTTQQTAPWENWHLERGFKLLWTFGLVRCFRCQSYGHGTASCRGVATCNKCSSTEHASEACTTERRKCANCKGEHAAYSKICTKWQQEKEIQRIKVLENLSYSEAKKRVVNILKPRTSSSYANAVMTNTKSKNDTATQTEISNMETPTNIDNLTSEYHKDSPIVQKPITNNLIEQETTLSPPETSFTDLESLNLDKRSPETLYLSVPSNTEVLMEIDKISTKRPATGNVQEAAKILKPSIRIESGGIQTTKEV